MQAAVLKVTISLDTGKVLSREIVDRVEMDEDEYYRTLVEVFSKGIERLIEVG